jgi:hypothetical protein
VISFEWRDVTGIGATSVIVGGVLLAFLRFKLAGDFAAQHDLLSAVSRLTSVEQRLSTMPSHDDLRLLQSRVGELERAVAVVAERVGGVHEILKRVEHQTGLLVHHQLREGKRDA